MDQMANQGWLFQKRMIPPKSMGWSFELSVFAVLFCFLFFAIHVDWKDIFALVARWNFRTTGICPLLLLRSILHRYLLEDSYPIYLGYLDFSEKRAFAIFVFFAIPAGMETSTSRRIV